MCVCIAGFESRDVIGCCRDVKDVLRKAVVSSAWMTVHPLAPEQTE
jgi:hypothetical protein